MLTSRPISPTRARPWTSLWPTAVLEVAVRVKKLAADSTRMLLSVTATTTLITNLYVQQQVIRYRIISEFVFAHSHLLLEYTSVCATVLPQTSQQLWLPPQPLLKKGFQDLLLRATTVRSITPLAYPILDTLTLSLSPPIKPALSTAIVLSPLACAVRLVSAFAQP